MSTDYRALLNRYQGMRDVLIRQKTDADNRVSTLTAKINELDKAREIVNAVMLATQVSVKDFIEEVVTLSLKTVFGENYSFKVVYEIKRNKPDATLLILKDGLEFDPKDEVGGGVIDVAALGLRMAMWALANPKPEPILILDEPGRCVSRDLIEGFARMLKICSEMLGLQIICVSHDAALVQYADRSFEVSQQNGISSVVVV